MQLDYENQIAVELERPIIQSHINVENIVTANQALSLFLIEEFYKELANYSISYAQIRYNKKFHVNSEEIKAYLYIYINTSVVNLPQIDMLWYHNSIYSTIISNVITKIR